MVYPDNHESGMSDSQGSLTKLRVEETFEARLERLGRERPASFPTARAEIGFCFSVIMSQFLVEVFVSGFNIIIPTITVDLGFAGSASVWSATAFPLVVASTLLFFGRLADQHGGFVVYVGGVAWLTVWSVVGGFSTNPMMLIACRALQGLGPAAFLPSGVMLLGSAYRPGPRKNIVFSMYGGAGVVGFFTGIFFGGLVGQYTRWGWFFWIGAITSFLTFTGAICFVPNDRQDRVQHQIEMDWPGAGLIVSGLVLFVFSITESARATDGWRTPYIATLFSLSITLLLVAVYVEGWVATRPLLPADLFTVPKMKVLTLSLFLQYGTVGIYLFYGTQYFERIMGAEPLQIVAWYVPMAVGGVLLAASEGLLLHTVPGRVLLVLSGVGAVGSQLLLALVPVGGNYWAYIFPSMILGTIGIDLSVTLMMVFVTTSMPIARQGLAGGLVNSVLQLGQAVALGLADIILVRTSPLAGEVQGYKNVFWFGVAAGGASFVLLTVWGDVPKASSELTADERAELARPG